MIIDGDVSAGDFVETGNEIGKSGFARPARAYECAHRAGGDVGIYAMQNGFAGFIGEGDIFEF